MTMDNLKKSQLYLAIRCGFERQDEVMAALYPSPAELKELIDGEAPEITKATLFSTLNVDKGQGQFKAVSFFAYKDFLKHLPDLMKELMAKGVEFKPEDFTKTLSGTKSPLDLAEEAGNHEALMNPEVWAGRISALEDLYHALSNTKQAATDFAGIKRKAAHAGGLRLREDDLDDAAVTIAEIVSAAKKGEMGPVDAKLKAVGHKLEKGDLTIASAWKEKEVWEKYDKIHETLAANGSTLEFADFYIKFRTSGSTRKTILDCAIESEKMSAAVKAQYWVGHALQLEELLDDIPNDKKSKNGINAGKILSELAELEYAGRLEKLDLTSLPLDYLTQPLTSPVSLKDSFNGQEPPPSLVTPLGVPSFWKKGKEVYAALKEAGTPLEPAHLLAVTSYGRETGLIAALRAGQVRTVMEIYKDAGMVLTPAALKVENSFGDTALKKITDEDMKEVVFDPQYWVGHIKEMKELHSALDLSVKNKIAIDEIVKGINRASIIREAERVEFDPFS